MEDCCIVSCTRNLGPGKRRMPPPNEVANSQVDYFRSLDDEHQQYAGDDVHDRRLESVVSPTIERNVSVG